MKKDQNLEPEKVGYRDVLRQKEYVKVILASLVNRFGDSIDAIAFTWLVYAITQNAAWSALVFAVNQLPSVLVQPFAGALVEGMDKKKLMVGTDIVRGMITGGLAVLYVTGNVTPWILLAFTLINSTVEAFRLPAGMAVIPQILEEKYYTYGTSLNSVLSMVVQLIGLGMAGLIISAFGIGTAIAIDGISFFGSALFLSFLKLKEKNLKKGMPKLGEYFSTLGAGIVYLKEQPVIRNFCIMGVFVNAVVVPLNSLQTPLIQEVLGQGSELLSIFSITLTVGMAVGSLLYPVVSKKCSVRTSIVSMGVSIGIGMYLYTVGGYFKSSVMLVSVITAFLSFVIGMGASIVTSALSVQFMKTVEKEYLARVGSIFNAGACAAAPVTSFLLSAVASFFSVAQIFKLCGIFCVIIFLIVGLFKVRLE